MLNYYSVSGAPDISLGGFDGSKIESLVRDVKNNISTGFQGSAPGAGEPELTLDQLVALAKLYVGDSNAANYL